MIKQQNDESRQKFEAKEVANQRTPKHRESQLIDTTKPSPFVGKSALRNHGLQQVKVNHYLDLVFSENSDNEAE